MRIDTWLKNATTLLHKKAIPSARLDSEIILAHILQCSRTYIHAHTDQNLTPQQHSIADACLKLRSEHVPIAYITGQKEFYGHTFIVTTATLVPRPESESCVSLALDVITDYSLTTPTIVDVGTGSGCIGISIKKASPTADVTLIDIDKNALSVAQKNSDKQNVTVSLLTSSLLENYHQQADIIVANLPYVNPDWKYLSEDTKHEPDHALYAQNNGLSLIYQLLDTIKPALKEQSFVILESDASQHDAIIAYATKKDLVYIKTQGLCMLFGTTASLPSR